MDYLIFMLYDLLLNESAGKLFLGLFNLLGRGWGSNHWYQNLVISVKPYLTPSLFLLQQYNRPTRLQDNESLLKREKMWKLFIC